MPERRISDHLVLNLQCYLYKQDYKQALESTLKGFKAGKFMFRFS